VVYLLETEQAQVEIPDLRLFVRRGSPVWVSEEEYAGSFCLHKLEQIGSVRATLKQRGTPVSRSKSHMSNKKRHPQRLTTPKTSRLTSDDDHPSGLTKAEVRALIAQTARETAAQVMAQVSPHLQQGGVSSDTSALEARLEGLVQRALVQSGGSPIVSPSVDSGPADPMFIPEGIVQNEGGPRIEVQSESSQSGSLGSAAAALRKLKQSSKGESEL